MNRARIYIRSAKPELAIRDYEHAAMLQPDNPDPLLMQAKVYAEMGKKGEARKKADEAKAKGARVDDAFYRSLL
jgi:cytochrome c-type biogenesis protein CcmH/NrfG